jgi:uncharacterized integral membrane protein (TIGR00697 family)
MSAYRLFDLIMAAFVTVLVVSNVASSAKIIDLRFSLFGIQLAFDAGTLLFPVSYIFGDILSEVYGYKNSRRVIWAGFFCLGFSALVFAVVRALPGEATWEQYVGQDAYQMILGGMSSGGIVIASMLGYWSGEFTNSFTLAKLKIVTDGKLLWIRTISSTLIGQFIDTAVFVFVASSFHVFPWSLFLTLVLSNYLFKCVVEVLMTPLTYTTVNFLKRLENEDYYDTKTDFNPFRI